MPASFILPGVPPLAYYKSRTLSFRATGSKGNWYEFRHDEPTPVYVNEDLTAFKVHPDLYEVDEDGKMVKEESGPLGEDANPRSYRRFAPADAPTISTSTIRRKKTDAKNPGSQPKLNLETDSEIEAFEKRREEQLRTYRRSSGS